MSCGAPPRVSISLTRYREPNALVEMALRSLAEQRGVAGEVLFLDQQSDAAFRREVEALGRDALAFEYRAVGELTLSAARNEAIRLAAHDTLLFLDADAVADSRWALNLARALQAPRVGVAGARVLPVWSGPPLLLMRSGFVREQYSVLDLGHQERDCTKVVGAGFGIRRSRLAEDAVFDETLGRRAGRLLGGEEMDLCDRAARRGLIVRYAGGAVVHHHIGRERMRYGWLIKRMYYGGFSRALRSDYRPRATHRMRSVADYLSLGLLAGPYALGYLMGWTRRPRGG